MMKEMLTLTNDYYVYIFSIS